MSPSNINHSILVSIVIPTYNREKSLSRAIASAQAQTYPHIEILITDNASSDNTPSIVRSLAQSDPRIRYHRHPQNLGPVPNWLSAIRLAQGSYIKILFSDDVLEPEAVELLLQPFLLHPKTLAFSYATATIHTPDKDYPHTATHPKDSLIPSLTYFLGILTEFHRGPFSPCIALFRRQDLLEHFQLSTIPHSNPATQSSLLAKGIGYDAILLWRTAARYPYVYALSKPLIHFYGYNLDNEKCISTSTPFEELLEGYRHGFYYFLATSKIPPKLKTLIYELLFFDPHSPKIRFRHILKSIPKIFKIQSTGIPLNIFSALFYFLLAYYKSAKIHRF
ncbi:MAG: glycosyltransferase [Chthoniobacterales bacterium]|nr:glycosyltransferase [Chthoniobacterales bacterium]